MIDNLSRTAPPADRLALGSAQTPQHCFSGSQRTDGRVRRRQQGRFYSGLPLIAVKSVALICAFVAVFAWGPQIAWAQKVKTILRDVGLDQRLDAQVPLDLMFRDETGKQVRLQEYFGKKPVILTLVYYRCPMLCTQVLNGLLRSSQGLQLTIGDDYEVVTVSFDHRETPELAAQKKSRYVRSYRREGAEQGWHFLTGEQQAVEKLARTVGFRYHYDPPSDQFAHASGIIILTPQGRISRYFYGIEYHPNDLRLGLVESSQGEIGSLVDQVLLLCYHYDPATGTYGFAIANALRIAGCATLLILGWYLIKMFRQERRRERLLHDAIAPELEQLRPVP